MRRSGNATKVLPGAADGDPMKLQLFLSHNGILSRRKAFESILAGQVSVNGRRVTEPSMEIDQTTDKVDFKGREIKPKRFEYVMLNKPAGYVTTCEGQFGQRTVMQLLPRELSHLRPVGRLDKDTEGLLILTNDGWLANRLMHPSFDVDKTYFVRARWRMTPEKIKRLEEGIILAGERTAPARVKMIRESDLETELEMTIHEGKKRQVRVMLSSVGNPVVQLRRLRQGPLELGNLRSADWRRLNPDEIDMLKNARPRSEPCQGDGLPVSRRDEFPGKQRSGPDSRGARGRRRGQKESPPREPGLGFGGKNFAKPNFGFRAFREGKRAQAAPLPGRPYPRKTHHRRTGPEKS